MFRTIVFVAGLLFASASDLTEQANPQLEDVGEGDWQKHDQLADCALHGAEAVDSMLDAVVYILAAMERCGDDAEKVRCAVDVSSAVGSVNEVVNVVMKAVSKCGAYDGSHAECGMATGVLTRAMAQLSAATTEIMVKCPSKDRAKFGGPVQVGAHGDVEGYSNSLGECVINVKNSMRELFKVCARFMTLKTNCEEETNCAHNALKIVAAFAGIGEYVAGALAECHPDPKTALTASCTAASLELVRAVDNVGRAAEGMSNKCQITEAERLFLDNEDTVSIPSEGNGVVSFTLFALLPVAAVLGFVGGSRFAKARTLIAHDAESLVELTAEE